MQLKKEYYKPYLEATESMFIKERMYLARGYGQPLKIAGIIELSTPAQGMAVFKSPESA